MLVISLAPLILTKMSLSLFMDEENNAVWNYVMCPKSTAGEWQNGNTKPYSVAPKFMHLNSTSHRRLVPNTSYV